MIHVFTDPRCLRHEAPWGFPEQPARLQGIQAALRRGDRPVLESIAHDGAEAAIDALHHPAYVRRFRHAVERGDGLLDSADNPLSAGSWEAARVAVQACLAAADHVASAPGRAAFAAVRPPGHHAEADVAMGFCYFANLGLAADYLIRRHGVEKAAVFDFDVHHGNGTQHLFEERPDVFFASIHQYPFYPGTGAAGERGRGAGEGATLNVPVRAGTGDEAWLAHIRDDILPALRRFAPEVVLVSAGFDAWREDPIGGLRISREAFHQVGLWIGELAEEVAQGRILVTLEGGYDLRALPGLVEAHLSGLEGREVPASEG